MAIDFSPVVAAGDWSGVVVGIVAVAAAVVVVYVAWRGAAMLAAAVRGGEPTQYLQEDFEEHVAEVSKLSDEQFNREFDAVMDAWDEAR